MSIWHRAQELGWSVLSGDESTPQRPGEFILYDEEDGPPSWSTCSTCAHVLCSCGNCHSQQCNELCRHETGYRSAEDLRS